MIIAQYYPNKLSQLESSKYPKCAQTIKSEEMTSAHRKAHNLPSPDLRKAVQSAMQAPKSKQASDGIPSPADGSSDGACFLGLFPQAPRAPVRKQCCCMQGDSKVSRRGILRAAAGAVALGVLGKSPVRAEEPRCRNCSGSGKVPCELCKGTGFWRALSGNNPNLRYKGVVCPECEGVSTLTCPVCLGTGEGNVRGLLRRRVVPPGPGRILQSGGVIRERGIDTAHYARS